VRIESDTSELKQNDAVRVMMLRDALPAGE